MNSEFEPLSEYVKKNARHKAEIPLYLFLVILNTVIIIGVLALFIYNISTMNSYSGEGIFDFFLGDDLSYYQDASDSFFDGMGIQLFQYLIYLFVFIFISINLTYAYYRSMSIRITPWNFPEVYEMIDTYCKKLGMETPEAYLMNSNGVMNAMSTFIVRKQYLEIDVDLFEVAYREHHDMDTLGFVIAHELSHIYYRHAHFGVYMSTCISYSIPVIGSALSRAREYSCDRLAQRITDNYGVDAMMALIAGKHLYKQVDMEDYIMQAQHAKNGFFITLYNLTSSHPIMSKRVLALLEGKGSGKLF